MLRSHILWCVPTRMSVLRNLAVSVLEEFQELWRWTYESLWWWNVKCGCRCWGFQKYRGVGVAACPDSKKTPEFLALKPTYLKFFVSMVFLQVEIVGCVRALAG